MSVPDILKILFHLETIFGVDLQLLFPTVMVFIYYVVRSIDSAAYLCDLARHFRTDPTETVALRYYNTERRQLKLKMARGQISELEVFRIA
jgi:hypothetical protein